MSDGDEGGDQESQPELTKGFDRYRSLLDPAVTIFVAKDAQCRELRDPSVRWREFRSGLT